MTPVLCLWTSRRTSRLHTAPSRHWTFFFERFFSYTARINFGHPNGVTKVPRTRHLCKNLSSTELLENWFNNLIQPPIPAILGLFGHVGFAFILGSSSFLFRSVFIISANGHLAIPVCYPTVRYWSPKKMYPISIMVHLKYKIQ